MTWFMRYCCSFRYSSFRDLAHPTIDDVCSFRATMNKETERGEKSKEKEDDE
jgi:hypothetical protein